MSTYDRMKQVKDLLANPSGLHLKSNISLNSIARLLNDSKSKVNQLLINQNQSSIKAAAVDKSLDLTSMKNLANYVLYDDVEPIAAASCLFDLSDLDQNQVKYFAGEIDAIESELIDMSAQIKSLQSAYKTYYEDFLSLCDRKDELFELFLDYYEEYILNVSNTDESNKLAIKSAAPNKTTKVRLKSNRRDSKSNGGGSTTKNNNNKQATEDKENVNKSEDEDQYVEPVVDMPRLKSGNLTRRKSNIYIYSVPTENRFSILSRTDSGTTLIKYY